MIAWLVQMLIATAALMALVLAVRLPVRRLFGPGVAYALWLLPAARAVMPSLTTTVERVVPAASALPVPDVAATPLVATAASADWTMAAFLLWATIAAAMLSRGLLIYRAQHRAILEGSAQLATLDGIRIVRSERVAGPLAFGIVDRVIALPLDFDQRFSERQRCLALDHELAHHRRGDLVANLFAFVLLCLQWFNPLAWAAHVAFRFDQEAACDARVLDKAQPGDRATYGTAIAKAASGRTLLFAGALDRPSTLSRRLTLMTQNQSRRARSAGFFLVGAAVLVALPLSASRAIDYVDVPAVAPPAPVPAVMAAGAIPAVAPVAPVVAAGAVAAPAPPAPPAHRSSGFSVENDRVTINGVTKRWDELTPAERSKIRADIADARADIDRELARLPAEMAQANREMAQLRNGEFKREMAEARAEIQRAMAEVHANQADLKAHGVDPAKIMADVSRSLAEVERMDVDKIVRDAMASVDWQKIQQDVRGASRSLDEIDAKLDRLDRQ